jgi:hypothetical protein
MTRTILNTFPTWVIAVVLVGGFVALTVVGQKLVHRRLAGAADGKFNESVYRLLTVLVAVFGFVLAFTIVSLYQSLNEAQVNVDNEATLLSLVYRDARVFDADVRADIDDALDAYVHEVVEHEWPLMAEGKQDEVGVHLIDDLFDVFESWEPHTATQKTFYSDAVSKLNEVAEARRHRLEDAHEELPLVFEILIFSGAFALMGCLWLFAGPNPTVQLLLISVIAFLVGLNLLLVVILDHPFAGDLAVSPRPFRSGDLRVFW